MPPAKASTWTTPRPSKELPAPIESTGSTSGAAMPSAAPKLAPAAVPIT